MIAFSQLWPSPDVLTGDFDNYGWPTFLWPAIPLPVSTCTTSATGCSRRSASLIDIALKRLRVFHDQPPGSGLPKTPDGWKQLIFEAGRGKAKCQDDNVLVDISLVNGVTTAKVLADSPALRDSLLSEHVNFSPGATLTNGADSGALLREVRAFRKGPGQNGDCRFEFRSGLSSIRHNASY